MDRPLRLFEGLEPSKVILTVGDEPTDASFLAQNTELVERLSNQMENVEVEKVSARDPHAAARKLTDIFSSNTRDYNIIVSPLGTKLQVVGLYLACETHPEVQIVYSFPDVFTSWLSKGIKETLVFHLHQ